MPSSPIRKLAPFANAAKVRDTNEVRIAYAIDKADLKRAIFLLGKALEQYPGHVNP